MAKSKGDNKDLPSSIRLPEDLKVYLKDYCWLNHTTINKITVELLHEFKKKHPITAKQQSFIDEHRLKE